MPNRLHPAPDIKNVDYIWYATRVQAMSAIPEFYGPDGWTELSQQCFKWLATVPGTQLPFKIKKIHKGD